MQYLLRENTAVFVVQLQLCTVYWNDIEAGNTSVFAGYIASDLAHFLCPVELVLFDLWILRF